MPTLEVTLPQSWESNAAYLVKEQDGKLAKMSDVTVTNDKESTTLVMTVTSLDGDCYVIGGVTEEQNKGSRWQIRVFKRGRRKRAEPGNTGRIQKMVQTVRMPM